LINYKNDKNNKNLQNWAIVHFYQFCKFLIFVIDFMKHTILVVDDDELILNTYIKQLSSHDLEVYAAGTPEQAKAILEKVTPELVLLDLILTKNDGSTGIRDYMKSEPRLENVPVLVMTNLEKPELKEMLLSEGVKEYLIKGSMGMDELRKKIMGYLEP